MSLAVIDNETKTRIFMVAAHLFAQKGFNGVSMREISERAGVTKPTIYYYYKNKEEIYRALIDAGIEHGRADLDRLKGSQLSFRQLLIEIIREKIRDCAQFTDFSKILIDLHLSTERLDFLDGFKERAHEPLHELVRMIRAGQETGELNRTIDPRLAAEIISAVVLYYLRQQVERGGAVGDEHLAERIVEMIFSGLGTKQNQSSGGIE
jgi:AcrR family transcriptional regulator